MKITMENDLIEFHPESASETNELNELWKVMVDCAKFNKKLVPIGEYMPPDKKIARFAIEN